MWLVRRQGTNPGRYDRLVAWVRRGSHGEAHLTIVFIALAVSRTVQNQTGLSLRRVLRTFEPLRSATVEINGVTTTIPPALSPAEAAILNAMQAPTARH